MWPKNAVPEHVVDDLFTRLTAIYGQRFVDMWHQAEPQVFRETWGLGLKGFTANEIKRGIGACFHTKYAPTLPEFLELCRPPPKPTPPASAVPHACLTDQREPVTAEGSAQAAMLRNEVVPQALSRPDGIAWAYRLLERRTANGLQIAFAKEAIARWHATHHVASDVQDDPLDVPTRVPSPHIYGDREPGSDDEEVAA